MMPLKIHIRTIASSILIIHGILCGCSRNTEAVYPAVGDGLPTFSLALDDGTLITSDHLKETDCILAFFHTGCPDCRTELPVIDTFAQLHPETEVYAISREQGQKDIEEYWRHNGLTLRYSVQTDRNIYSLFAASGIPHTVVSRKGTIAAVFTDSDSLTTEILEGILHRD